MKGHNENTVRLSMLADEASRSLVQMQSGEEGVIGSWLAYGHALNEARSLFPSDEQFGQWIDENGLRQVVGHDGHPREVNEHERAAAMWAAANADQFEEARQRGNPRTIRGIHAKWKEIEAERAAERVAEEQRKMAEAREAAKAEEIPSERTNREDGAIGRKGYAPDGSSRLSSGRMDDPSDTGETVEDGDEPAAGGSPAPDDEPYDPVHAEKLDAAPEPAPDPYGYAKLTEEALLETANGLRADLDDEKSDHKKTKAKLKDANGKLADFTADEKDEVIRRLQAEVKNAGNAKWKAIEDRDAYHRQVNKLKKRVAELEQMGVAY